jgi:hypothetical protein
MRKLIFFRKEIFIMFGKIAKTIIAVELAAMAVIGGWVYSEVRYHQGREDAAKEIAVEAKFRELAKETLEKHGSEKEEA